MIGKFLPVVTRVYSVTVILISWLLHKLDGLLQTVLQVWATAGAAVLHRAG